MEFLLQFIGNPLSDLILIIVLGLAIGRVKVWGLSLGASGVLFSALFMGYLHSLHPKEIPALPPIIGSLGVVFFVYAVGLQAGPRFFGTFRSHGRGFVMIALATLVSGALATLLAAWALDISPALSVGIYTGALTTTPGLAAAVETLNDPLVSVGYGVAYPFGVAGVVVFVQLLPRLMRVDLNAESVAAEAASKGPKISTAWYKVTNPNCVGKTINDLGLPAMTKAVLSRINRGGESRPVLEDIQLALDDLIKVAGTKDDRRVIEALLGPKVEKEVVEEKSGDIIARDVYITRQEVGGKTLEELRIKERYGLVVTRLWRQDIEFLPGASTRLEFGDLARAVGPRPNVMKFMADFGQNEKRLHETNFLPLMLGMLVGVLLGMYEFSLFGTEFKLGMAGGPLFVALVAAHYGRIGALTIHVPVAARIFTRELGLMLFLASAGMKAGEAIVPTLQEQGLVLLVVSIWVTVVPVAVAFGIARLAGVPLLSSLGLICGAMTSTPGLGAATAATDSEAPALAYATVYPAALILVTMLAQGLALLLVRLVGA